jgi:DNA-binding NarL/FixJ family response regulator
MLGNMLATSPQTPIPFIPDQLAALRVFIADDHALYRQVLVRAIDRHPDLALAGEASDGETALTGILETAPDVALLDLRMPDLDGLEACRRVRAINPDIAVVILTAFDDETTPARASAAGATACLGKDATETDICQALLTAGDGAFPPDPPLL